MIQVPVSIGELIDKLSILQVKKTKITNQEKLLYINKEFVGGCDIVKEMYESGELAKLFEAKGINFKAKN